MGNQQIFVYDANGKLITLTDNASGRVLTFHYTAGGLLNYIEGPVTPAVTNGIWVTYGYDGNNNLTSVTYADGSGFNYEYAPPNTNENQTTADYHNLTAKKDKQNYTLSSWAYDAKDRSYVNSTRDGKGVTIDYTGYDAGGPTIDVTDAYGVERTYTITKYDKHFPKVTGISEAGCTSCAGEMPIRYEYDPVTLNVTEEEYANGTINQYQNYDAKGNPGTVILAAGTAEQRTITYTYHPQTSEKMSATEASVLGAGNKETIWDFDNPTAQGNTATPNESPTALVYRLIEKGFTKNDAGTVIPYEYITTYTYNTKGQMTSVDGPLTGATDTTSYGYDSTTGNLLSITQPLIGNTTFAIENYDGAGNPGSMTDINGQITTFTHDGKNRLLSSTINGIQNSRSFNTAGELATVSDTGNRVLTYTYDPIYGRLERITDMQSNYLFYAYDAQGNTMEDSAVDSAGVKKRLAQFDYQNPDKRGLLWKIIDPEGTATVYTYNDMNDVATATDQRSRMTSYNYDPLKRLKQMIQPGTVTTNYGYDLQGNRNNVTDATNKPTNYVYDDLGRVLSEDSPDSGLTKSVYDFTNNQIRITDANEITATYVYDVLGRLTNVNYPNSTQNTIFSYDQGANGRGKLTGMTDAGGTTLRAYNTLGQMTQETRTNYGTVDPVTVGYGYNQTTADLDSFTYPSGMVVSYQRDTNGNISAIQTSGQNVISNVTRMPFGPVEDYVVGNNVLTIDRTFNQRYLLESILDITPSGTAVMGIRYQYNTDGTVYSAYPIRLESGMAGGPPIFQIPEFASTLYFLNPNTNQLDSSTGGTEAQYSYDLHGNITSNGTKTFVYNQNNRLVEVWQDSALKASYAYDGYGRRVKKVVGEATTFYHYDSNNNLIAETDLDGSPIREYIYLGSEPVAMKLYGAQAGMYYYLNNYLGTPQKMINSAGVVVWDAAYRPFGNTVIIPETIKNNLRMPGQYYDAETGLHYNWHRYYDPSTGRYLTPDPIGLAGGINPFTYTSNNPINWIDPEGLSTTLPSPGDKHAAEKVKKEHPELWKGKKNDKFKHCALGCQITKEYGPWTANNAALWKEVKDEYDNDPSSHCESKDFDASLDGVKVGVQGGDCVAGCEGAGHENH